MRHQSRPTGIEYRSNRVDNPFGIVPKPAPGESKRMPARGDQHRVPQSIRLETLASSVKLPAVKLNGHALVWPVRIDLEPVPGDQQILVRSRCRHPGGGNKRDEAPLELRPRDVRFYQREATQLSDPAPPLTAIEHLAKFAASHQAQHLRLMKQPSYVARTEDGT